MSDTRLHTLGEVSTLMEGLAAQITLANGCETDIGTKVFVGRKKIDDDLVPCFVLHEAEDVIVQRDEKKPNLMTAQRYVLIGYDKCDAENPNRQAHKIIRDLKRMCFAGDKKDMQFGGKVHRVTYQGKDIGARPDGVAIVLALIEISVVIVEVLSEP